MSGKHCEMKGRDLRGIFPGDVKTQDMGLNHASWFWRGKQKLSGLRVGQGEREGDAWSAVSGLLEHRRDTYREAKRSDCPKFKTQFKFLQTGRSCFSL